MPSLSEALQKQQVVQVLSDMWQKTQQTRNEWGGWIWHNGGVGTALQYGVKTKTSNQPTSIILTAAADLTWLAERNLTILADFHCHPGGPQDIAGGRPSDADIDHAKDLSYGRLVFTWDTNHYYNIKPLAAPTPAGFPDGCIMWCVR